MSNDSYPLIENAGDSLRSRSGRLLRELELEAAQSGDLRADDLRIEAQTLRKQAAIAAEAGYSQLAANLNRAAELTAVPNEEMLQIYELLRPGRASYETLMALAERLESLYEAPLNAEFVREAAAAYQRRGLLRREA